MTTPKTPSKTPRRTGKYVSPPAEAAANSSPVPEARQEGGASHGTAGEIFAPGGILSQALKGAGRNWEDRPEQRAMARAVETAIEKEAHLLIEAGTGVGKSYAYLVPFILWAVENRKRVLIATHTKALQQQLVERDLPFLRILLKKELNIDFRFALCLGTQNYLCPRRLAKSESLGIFNSPADEAELEEIRSWSERTKTGRSLDLPFEPRPHLWAQINRESDLCLGRACPLYEDSFFYIARRKQENAHILVANHHLLFAHLAAGGNESAAVLPSFDGLVIDEAHQTEEVAAAYLGLEVSNFSIARLIEQLHHRRNDRTILHGTALPDRIELEEKLIDAAEEAREATGRFFENLQVALRLDASRPQTLRLREAGTLENTLEEPLARLEKVLRAARKSAERTLDEELERELEGYLTRCFDLRTHLTELLNHSHKDWVYWLACQPRLNTNPQFKSTPRVPRLALHGAPVDVAAALQESLFGKVCPVVLTSATLTTGSNFEFLRERLGLTPEQSQCAVDTLSLGSPFDFESNAMIYIARDLPDPGQAALYESAAIRRAGEVLLATNGRAFVLCTSFRMVDATVDALRKVLPRSITILRQGEMARNRLLDTFRKDTASVLVGTSSFWQGVDVPGESLSCVVIMKLPFAVPDDPMVQARIEKLKEQGRNAFSEYQVPQAVMMFRQGFGRLIRTASDRGVVAILDPRTVTKSYGSTFLKSLPECRVTEELSEVAEFSQEKKLL